MRNHTRVVVQAKRSVVEGARKRLGEGLGEELRGVRDRGRGERLLRQRGRNSTSCLRRGWSREGASCGERRRAGGGQRGREEDTHLLTHPLTHSIILTVVSSVLGFFASGRVDETGASH